MSQANQVAIAGPSALAEPARSARNGQHNIPRFLLKLYEIINDPANDQLIKWSEAGDSFYIYHQERFAREVLGKWFKHQNFSSFVRQLNLYGFRKISALQQGLLRMDHDAETIQFAHPYFHRGQPDLLALIQRKRHPPSHTQAEEAAAGLLQASQEGKLSEQMMDVRSIVDGITAIRRQQQAISADLSALKQSNDALWKEAIEARQRHAKHEDTINRILKFLAGLFGRVMQGHNREQLNGERQAAPRRQVLMIGDGRPSHDGGADKFGGTDFDVHSDTGSRAQSPFSVASERFATIETPDASVASPGAESAAKSPPKPHQRFSEWQSKDSKVNTGANSVASTSNAPLPPASPSGASASEQERSTPNAEAMWQATFHQMLNSPAQFHRIVQAFANTQPYPTPGPAPGSGTGQPYISELSNALQLPPYSSPTPAVASLPQQQQITYPPLSVQQPTPTPFHTQSQYSLAVGQATPAESALIDNTARMQKTYRDTAEIDADIDVLQSNIHSLIRDMGLDPNNVSFPTIPEVSQTTSASAGVADAGEFPFDSWLNQLSNSSTSSGVVPGTGLEGSHAGEEYPAFLDLPSFDSGVGSAPAVTTPSTGVPSPTGQKRKIEVVEIADAPPGAEVPSSKKKR